MDNSVKIYVDWTDTYVCLAKTSIDKFDNNIRDLSMPKWKIMKVNDSWVMYPEIDWVWRAVYWFIAENYLSYNYAL